MKKESLYLETSVISAYFDERDPNRLEFTRVLWKKLHNYVVTVSKIVLSELAAIGDDDLRSKALGLTKGFAKLNIGPEEEFLGDEYIKEGVIPARYRNDVLQIAVASTNVIDFMVSWNLEHIVKVKTRRMVNLINAKYGYKPIEIVTPSEL